MDWEQIRRNREPAKGALTVRQGKLTNDDLIRVGGERGKLGGRLQAPYGIGKEEAGRLIEMRKALRGRQRRAESPAGPTAAPPLPDAALRKDQQVRVC